MERPKYPKRVNVVRAEGMTSFRLSKIVGDLPLTRRKRDVLRAMADRYPNVWPSVDTLAEKAGYGTTATRQELRELEAIDGFIYEIPSPEGKSRKRGGRGCSVQYGVNVNRILDLAGYPTVSEKYPTVSNENPTLSDSKPDSKRWGTENKTDKNNREEITSDPRSFSERSSQWGEFSIWLARNYRDLSLTSRQQKKVKEVVLKYPYDLSAFQRAASTILNPLDCANSYDHAGDKLAANLETQVLTCMEIAKEGKRTREMVEVATRQAQESVMLPEDDTPEEL